MHIGKILLILIIFLTSLINVALKADDTVTINKSEKLSYKNTDSLYFVNLRFGDKISNFSFRTPLKENEIYQFDRYVRVVIARKKLIKVIRVEAYSKEKNLFRLSSLWKFDDIENVVYSRIPEFNNGPEIFYFKECTSSKKDNYVESCKRIKNQQ